MEHLEKNHTQQSHINATECFTYNEYSQQSQIEYSWKGPMFIIKGKFLIFLFDQFRRVLSSNSTF